MSLVKVIWGARQSGKTTAVLEWAKAHFKLYGKQMLYTGYASRNVKEKFITAYRPQPITQIPKLANYWAWLIEDIEQKPETEVVDIVAWAKAWDIRLVLSFTPPPEPIGEKHYLRILSKMPIAEYLSSHWTAEELMKVKQELSPQVWRSQYEGQFVDDV